jgi:hypothetical protein
LAVSLLQEFEDVFPKEMPSGLPPIKGIEHQIDLVPGAIIPNQLATMKGNQPINQTHISGKDNQSHLNHNHKTYHLD